MTGQFPRRHRVLEGFARSIAELADALESGRFVAVLLGAVQRLVHADFVMVFGYQGAEQPLMLGDTLDRERHGVIAEDYINGPYLLDPFYQLVEDGKREGCFRLHDIAPDRFRQSEYFRTHYKRTGIGEEIGFVFDAGHGITGVASLARWTSSPALARDELDLLRAVEPAIRSLCARHWSRVTRARLVAAGTVGLHPVAALEEFAGGVLSARERQIMTMILQGHSTQSLAHHLDISPGTVKIHRKNVYRKLNISTQAELFAAYLAFVQARPEGARLFPGGYTRKRPSPG
ncbi:MAG: LuxR C-terminal-related transcriptional regulator [Parvibaculaceae bacterium]